MSSCLLMATYNRPKLLGQVLSRILEQRPKVDGVCIVDDGSTDPTVPILLRQFQEKWKSLGGRCVIELNENNQGPAATYSYILSNLFQGDCFDHVVVLDSDTFVSPDDWPSRLVSFLETHPEVGMAVPDKPGCYLRLRRRDYEEIEWGVSICYATSRRAFLDATKDCGWWDRRLGTAWDCDISYRLRMLGYRIATVPGTTVTDMGADQSTVQHNIAYGNWTFNRKWNQRLFGNFIYKCPGAFLKWEGFPLNALFRQMINVQQGSLKISASAEPLCGHSAEQVSQLACVGTTATPEQLAKLLELDVSVREDIPFENIDPDIPAGRRDVDMEKDLSKFSLKAHV